MWVLGGHLKGPVVVNVVTERDKEMDSVQWLTSVIGIRAGLFSHVTTAPIVPLDYI